MYAEKISPPFPVIVASTWNNLFRSKNLPVTLPLQQIQPKTAIKNKKIKSGEFPISQKTIFYSEFDQDKKSSNEHFIPYTTPSLSSQFHSLAIYTPSNEKAKGILALVTLAFFPL